MAEFLVVTKRDYDKFRRADFDEHLSEEVARAREFYAQRVFRSIWARSDAGGAVIIMEADSEDHAHAIWNSMPLASKGMVVATITRLAAYHGFTQDY